VSDRAVPHVVLTVEACDVELASDSLFQRGARAIEERSVGDLVELWAVVDGGPAKESSASADSGLWNERTELVEPSSTGEWRAFARPITIDGRALIVPEWCAMPDTDNVDIVVTIDPGDSFGLGDHPTTQLACSAVLRHVSPGSHVLDMGCGSGVLSILAVRCGAERVLAIDRSPDAVAVTQHNVERNGAKSSVVVHHGNTVTAGELFDVVVANMLAPALVDLSERLVAATKPGGILILSGLIDRQRERVASVYTSLGTAIFDDGEQDGWASLSLLKPE
jgi:ribosomal protein L11 methyltransferase